MNNGLGVVSVAGMRRKGCVASNDEVEAGIGVVSVQRSSTRETTRKGGRRTWRTSRTSVRRLQAARKEEEGGAERDIREPGDRRAVRMRPIEIQKEE